MSHNHLSRRDFTKKVAASTAAVPLAAGATVLSDSSANELSAAEAEGEDKKPEPTPPDEEQLLLEVIKQQYPDARLTDEVLANIRRDIAGNLHRSRVLSSFPLKNSDEPATIFSAYRADDIR